MVVEQMHDYPFFFFFESYHMREALEQICATWCIYIRSIDHMLCSIVFLLHPGSFERFKPKSAPDVSHLKQQKYQVFVFWIFNKSYVFLSVSKRKPNCIFHFFESWQLILSLILYLMILNLQKISYNLPIVLAHHSINNRCAKLKKLSLVLDFLQSLCNRLKKVIAATQGRINHSIV